MQQYQVPQFITVEDKIFGPLTTKQFFYLLFGGGLTFLLWFFLNFYIFMLLATPVIVLSVSLAFVKVNGQPFINTAANFFTYFTHARLFLWKKQEKKINHKDLLATTPPLAGPKTSKRGKLNDLAWSLDVMEHVKR
jgi:hypothetical protein